jgi:hypothetical protein
LSHDPLLHLGLRRFTFRGNDVDLIDEEKARSKAASFVEKLADLLLGFARHAGDDAGTLDLDEGDIEFGSEGAGDYSFAAAGGTVEEDTSGDGDLASDVLFWHQKRKHKVLF